MKRLLIITAIILMGAGNVSAQQDQRSEEERTQMRAQMIKRVADRTAKDFDLKGDVRESFLQTFTAYQTEMFQTNMGGLRQHSEEGDNKKELTDEEANAKIREQFAHQEEQIATMQKRLEIQKKYSAEFAKVLTPQQVLKVLTPQRNNQRRQQRSQEDGQRQGGWQGGGRGGFGGPGGGYRGGFGGGF